MFNPLSLFTGSPWIYAGVFVAGMTVAAGATYGAVHTIDTVKLQALQLAQSKAHAADISASLSQLQGFIAAMHSADAGYNVTLDAINSQFAGLKKELAIAVSKPLPADCRPDVGRLRILTAAVGAANKGASIGQ